MVGATTQVRTGTGLVVAPQSLEHVQTADLLVVPALAGTSPEALLDHVGGDVSLPVRNLIARTRDRGTTIASACAGTFLLAEAGILDGVRATTTWWLSPAFRARYPGVHLDHSQMVITNEGITTAGAAFGHVDLALAIVRASSPALADLVARYLVVDERPSQSAYTIPSALAQSDHTVAAFERWIREHLAEPISIADAAKANGPCSAPCSAPSGRPHPIRSGSANRTCSPPAAHHRHVRGNHLPESRLRTRPHPASTPSRTHRQDRISPARQVMRRNRRRASCWEASPRGPGPGLMILCVRPRLFPAEEDRKSTRLNSSHRALSRMPSSA